MTCGHTVDQAVRPVVNYYAICWYEAGCAGTARVLALNSRVDCCLVCQAVFLCKSRELIRSALQRRYTDDNNPVLWCYWCSNAAIGAGNLAVSGVL